MHSTHVIVIGVVALGCAFAIAVCGGNSGYNPAAATNPSTNSPLLLSQCILEFARCRRQHGVPSLPDPTFPTGSGGPRGRTPSIG